MVSLDEHVEQSTAIARHLVNYSFPVVSPQDEEEISCLKQREITVDGYEIVVYFSISNYLDVQLRTLQLFGKYFTFLPFSLVCKIASKFLGDKELSFVEVMHFNQGMVNEYSRRLYVWTVYFKDEEPICNPFVTEFKPCTYEGFRYSHLDRNQIKFF
jgi:hypothetical protein